jgi:hypothetical protein
LNIEVNGLGGDTGVAATASSEPAACTKVRGLSRHAPGGLQDIVDVHAAVFASCAIARQQSTVLVIIEDAVARWDGVLSGPPVRPDELAAANTCASSAAILIKFLDVDFDAAIGRSPYVDVIGTTGVLWTIPTSASLEPIYCLDVEVPDCETGVFAKLLKVWSPT